ncbi:hypothetical protein ACKFKG_32985 [Phormidesmis sp. 146-35]
MVLSTPQTQTLKLHMMLQQTETGQVMASVVEMPDCRVTAATREDAIDQLRQMVTEHLNHAQVMPLDIEIVLSHSTKNPWTEFIGLYEGDADFAEITAELRRERGFDEMELME